ncbi:MAG TPA: ATP-binding cassette domain-containing protein [Ignavibacteria bacterium]|nr:ATP-binding cassette domain-containing protein [Ignavibacteria bacterium]
MNIENINGYTLNNINKINIILGKNGCGKSTMLRQLEQGVKGNETFGKSRYITPERGGNLIYTAGVEEAINNNIDWMFTQRQRNQSENFRQQSVAQYRKLETLILREFEDDQSKDKFSPYVDKINDLLDNIEIKRDELVFKIFKKGTVDELSADKISSGESELISLGIELLIFSKELEEGKENILFLDEPDVHLHPDLQARLIHFLEKLVNDNNFKIIIATHSTAILGALETSNTHIAFMTFEQKEIDFEQISETYRKILPVFGAHPLSNVFNTAPILLLEGEDDERVWQQVVRSSNGKVLIYPCSVESITNMNNFEEEAQKIIQSVYNDAVGYSLRDRDETEGEITDMLPIIRMKLSCRASENLLLSDEVLERLEHTWEQLKEKINSWLNSNTDHMHHAVMSSFKKGGYDRKSFDIKLIRNDIMGIIGSEKPWEVVVGQTIASLTWNATTNYSIDGKVFSFLGEKIVKNLLQKVEA